MKLYGIIGNPLDRSPSPKIFQSVFRKLKTEGHYLPFWVEKKHLKNLVLCMKLCDVEGLNVTIPYKEAVIPYLDRLDSSARRAGAVNTIVRKKNKFIGYNTDGAGFIRSLREKRNFRLRGEVCTLLGAGGTARGIAAALGEQGVKTVHIHNRHRKKAEAFCRHFKKSFPKTLWKAWTLNRKESNHTFPETQLLVQCTPASPRVALKSLPSSALVADIVYSPIRTEFLIQAEHLGLKTLDGLWMLLYQHTLNLKLWTGRQIDPNWLRKKVL